MTRIITPEPAAPMRVARGRAAGLVESTPHHGPPLAWMLLVLRELAEVPMSDAVAAYPEDLAVLEQIWFGEKGGAGGS